MSARIKILSLIMAVLALSAMMIGLDYWQSARQKTISLDGTYAESFAPFSLPLSPDTIFTPLYPDDPAKTIGQMAGQTVLVNVWASWCAPCVKEMPQLVSLAASREDITLVLLSVDEQRQAATRFLQRFSAEMGDNIVPAWDPDRGLSTRVFQSYRYPETILIGPDGYISGKLAGLVNWEDPDVLAMVEDLSQTHRQQGDQHE